jgi:ADP-ribosylglycohydrolase
MTEKTSQKLSETLSAVLAGVAVGDALGNRLEFLRAPSDADFQKQLGLPLVVSDDTQMTLFSLEAMRQGWSFTDAYLRWLSTQGEEVGAGDGLLAFPEMYDVQAPGRTCMSACRSLLLGKPVANDSKGNGTVMRCAHIAYEVRRQRGGLVQAISLAREDAETTHKHPYAAQSSQLLTAIHWSLIAGQSFAEAVASAIDCAPGDANVADLCRAALTPDRFAEMRHDLGGWVAEEALALAIGAVTHNALRISRNVTGDFAAS